MKQYPYSRANLKTGTERVIIVRGYDNLLIFDIDNDKYDDALSRADAKALLEKHGVSAMIISSRSDEIRIRKYPQSTKESMGSLYGKNIIQQSVTGNHTDQESYVEFQELTVKVLGLDKYADKSALTDRARFYYPSPQPNPIVVKGRLIIYPVWRKKRRK